MATFLIGQPGPHFKPAASAGTDGARSRIRARLNQPVTLTGAVVTNFSRTRAVRRTRAATTVCGSGTEHAKVCREAPPKRPQRTKIGLCEQLQLRASTGCGTISPAKPQRVPPSPCQRQSSLYRQHALKGLGEGATSGHCYAGRRPSSQVTTVVATGPARARASEVAQDRRAGPTVPRACRR
jgi:hypothetical protein